MAWNSCCWVQGPVLTSIITEPKLCRWAWLAPLHSISGCWFGWGCSGYGSSQKVSWLMQKILAALSNKA
jgi:hypothetical protein